jgi:hypothetical protein
MRKYEALMTEYKSRHLLPIFVAAFADGKVMASNVLKLDPEWVIKVNRQKARESGGRGTNDTETAIRVDIKNMVCLGCMSPEQLDRYKQKSV